MGTMPQTTRPLAPVRSVAEDALVAATVARLRAHGEPELADAVERARIKVYPWAPGRHRYRSAHIQVQVVVSAPEDTFADVPHSEAEIDRLLRAELGGTLSPALFPRTIAFQAA